MSRRRARKQAFLALYQGDVTGKPMEAVLERWRSHRGDFEAYALDLVRGVEGNKEQLDDVLEGVAEGWPVHRMSAVDRTILRIGLYEMAHVDDVPPEVAVNEASELATGFSGEESPAFVTGVLRGARERVVDGASPVGRVSENGRSGGEAQGG